MTDTSKCALCEGETVPMMDNGKIAQYKARHIKPTLPPFSLYICTKCGHWQIFALGLREQPKEITIDQVPEKVKRDLGLK